MKVNKIISSSYDKKQVWILPIVFLFLTVLLTLTQHDKAFIISIGIIFTIAIIGSYFLIPYRIEQSTNNLILKRIFGDMIIPISSIQKIEKIDYEDLKRKLGIGGLLGYYGNYHLQGWGDVRVLAKSSVNLVLIISSNIHPIIISVDDEKELVGLYES
jgi:hypothetical protein